MIRDYLATYDYNLPLDDAAVDPDLPLVRRRLASLAMSEGLNGGYYEARELAEAFLDRAYRPDGALVARGEPGAVLLDAAREANAEVEADDSPARIRLRDVLGRELDYQRELFDEVCELPLADAASHLVWLAELMRKRVDMDRPIEAVLGQRH